MAAVPQLGLLTSAKGITASELIPHLQDYNYWDYLNTDLVEGIIKRASGISSPLASLMAEYKENVRNKHLQQSDTHLGGMQDKESEACASSTLHHHGSQDQHWGKPSKFPPLPDPATEGLASSEIWYVWYPFCWLRGRWLSTDEPLSQSECCKIKVE